MNIHNTHDFDKNITRTIREMETKHKCWIWILSDESDWFINVCYYDDQRIEKEIKVAPLGCGRYQLAIAIRKHFR